MGVKLVHVAIYEGWCVRDIVWGRKLILVGQVIIHGRREVRRVVVIMMGLD